MNLVDGVTELLISSSCELGREEDVLHGNGSESMISKTNPASEHEISGTKCYLFDFQ